MAKSIQDIIQESMITQVLEQHENRLISALQKYLPDLTRQNMAKYGHRITQVTQSGLGGPSKLYLDHGTLNEVLVCTFGEWITDMKEEDGKVTFTANQSFQA